MMTTINNDILFDDAALINVSGQSAILPSFYNDCDNRHEINENISSDCNCSGYTAIKDDQVFSPTIAQKLADNFYDCTNNLIMN